MLTCAVFDVWLWITGDGAPGIDAGPRERPAAGDACLAEYTQNRDGLIPIPMMLQA